MSFDWRWHKTSRFFRSYIVKLTILAPAIGYLIILNQEFSSFFTLVFDSGAPEDSLNRVYYIFFGLTFIGVSAGIFEMFCPAEVKLNHTDKGFVESERPIITPARLRKYAADIGMVLSKEAGRDGAERSSTTGISFSSWRNRNEEEIIDVLTKHFYTLSESNRKTRIAMSLLYGLGWFFLLLPSTLTFIDVANITYVNQFSGQ
ncbi:MAG: hypothetical protein ABJ215_12285 [Alphaproteobacteria bacterium]